MRLNYDANSYADVLQYYTTRSRQALYDGITWSKQILPIEDWGYTTSFIKDGIKYESVYILEKHRGKGHAKAYWKTSNLPCLTSPSCNLQDFLEKIEKQYELMGQHTTLPAYQAIENWYEDKKAKRSQVYMMNHIDEGLGVLKYIGADQDCAAGFCLHPLVQMDTDLANNLNDIPRMPPVWLILAMEYRSVANEYLLSTRRIKSISEIRLSPLKQVNDMLIADKIQNYKDFCLYHKNSHSRSPELNQYFLNWFERLGLTLQQVNDIIKYITVTE